MPLPKQVQKQAAEIEQLEQQLYAETSSSDKPTAEVVSPEAEQSADSTVATEELTDTSLEASESSQEEEVVEDTGKVADTSDEDGKVWKQKYKTLQGMYDAEVPRLHQQVKTLTGELESLKETVETANKQVEQAKEEAEYERLRNLVTDKDREEFGDDLIEVQRKVAREETAELYKQLEAVREENEQLRASMEQTGHRVSQTSFEQKLNTLVPDFAQVNTDPSWIKWLDEQDQFLRTPRRVVAEKAYAEGDADAVAHFVTLFKQSQQGAEPAEKAVAEEIATQIQPSKSASSSSAKSSNGAVYTNDQVRNMFIKITKLNQAGKLEEARKLEAEIDLAYTQGRVAG